MPRVPSPAAAHIGGHISTHRQQTGMTQDQLAAASDIDSANIRAYENGRATPNVASLVRIAAALGIEAGALLDGVTVEMLPVAASDARRRAS